MGALEVSWAVLGAQMAPKMGPERSQNQPRKYSKNGFVFRQVGGLFWGCFGIPKKSGSGGLFFVIFWNLFSVPCCSILAPFCLHLGSTLAPSSHLLASLSLLLAPVGRILDPFWLHSGSLGLSWRSLGPVLVPSWHHPGTQLRLSRV